MYFLFVQVSSLLCDQERLRLYVKSGTDLGCLEIVSNKIDLQRLYFQVGVSYKFVIFFVLKLLAVSEQGGTLIYFLAPTVIFCHVKERLALTINCQAIHISTTLKKV